MDSNHHNTSTDNPAPTNHLPTTGNQTAPECGLVFDNDDGLQRMMDEQPKDDHHMSTEMKDELDELYYNFKCPVVQLAIQKFKTVSDLISSSII
ncbi:hypothetical protein H4Q26_007126 [Puccinia striiformis f. sp. tritici PST-130]|nr:hypothetical protein H4Q26_007126 [Puccinia striiformis f. sp. tritici PST-130]